MKIAVFKITAVKILVASGLCLGISELSYADNKDSGGGMSRQARLEWEIQNLVSSLNEIHGRNEGVMPIGQTTYLSKQLFKASLKLEVLKIEDKISELEALIERIDRQISSRSGGRSGVEALSSERTEASDEILSLRNQVEEVKASLARVE